jgi:hypothetical protein
MAARGISHAEVDSARSTTGGGGVEFVNPVEAFNDLDACSSEEYAIKARLVGDDELEGERIFFALRMDTLEILPFPMKRLLLPPAGAGKRRDRQLQELVALADSPPCGEDEPDAANVRLVLDVDGDGRATVSRCVQEMHFQSCLSSLCPKLLLCGLAPAQLAIIVSHDCRTIRDVFRVSREEPLQSRPAE